ncbi:MAG: nucleoside kinase, partial [Bacteroidales bacterium]|nr:nucleoside kinase [Bacteroidales bacterium]
KHIFPFEENADLVFNSSTLYDLPLLIYYAEPLLYGILESSPAYEKARQLLVFLENIVSLKPAEIAVISPTSIMMEFLGGQTL